LTQDRSECSEWNFFSVCRNNHRTCWPPALTKLNMASFLRNINKALLLKDPYNLRC